MGRAISPESVAAPIPTVEPTQIFAGDSLCWSKSFPDFSSADWTLSYRLLSQKGAVDLDVAAPANGTDFLVTVAAAVTAEWTAAQYTLIGYLTAGTQRVQVYRGKFEVLPDPATVDHFDGRSYLERILQLIEEVIEQGVIREVIRYSYGGVTTEVVSMEDAFKARERIKAAILQEEAEKSGKQRRILTKFVSAR